MDQTWQFTYSTVAFTNLTFDLENSRLATAHPCAMNPTRQYLERCLMSYSNQETNQAITDLKFKALLVDCCQRNAPEELKPFVSLESKPCAKDSKIILLGYNESGIGLITS